MPKWNQNLFLYFRSYSLEVKQKKGKKYYKATSTVIIVNIGYRYINEKQSYLYGYP